VQALATLGGPDGHTPAIDGFAEKVRPLSAGDKALIREAAKRQSEEVAKKQMGVEHWVHDVVCRRNGIDPILWPRLAGSWPEFVFTGDPLRLPAGHFGLGHGNGAHAPNEYYAIESGNPKIQGMDGAARSHVEYLYELAAV
jgi:hypothetical protein